MVKIHCPLCKKDTEHGLEHYVTDVTRKHVLGKINIIGGEIIICKNCGMMRRVLQVGI